jgi:hypothetical protein
MKLVRLGLVSMEDKVKFKLETKVEPANLDLKKVAEENL